MPTRLRVRVLGFSVERRPICVYLLPSNARRCTLIIGGFHGDEPKSVFVARRLVEFLENHPEARRGAKWIVVPLLNPDGYAHRKRRNARGVDLNRSFPTNNWRLGSPRSRMYGGPAPASEPETRLLMKLIARLLPSRIVTLHSIGLNRFCNNYDGPGRPLAEAMARCNRYPVTHTIGYPTPGSFGTWAGIERGIPVVTLELPSHHSPQRCWADNLEALLAAGEDPLGRARPSKKRPTSYRIASNTHG